MRHIDTLKTNSDFRRVYNGRKSFANKYLIMYCKANKLDHHRLGISISKKVGNSVVRHGFCRLVRESFRLNKDSIKDHYDIIVVARSDAKGKNFHEIESAFLHLIKLHKIVN